jgi:hypothetical protein
LLPSCRRIDFQTQATAAELLDKPVAKVLTDATDVEVERDVIEGMAVRVLLEEAVEADLLSVSRQCPQHAGCPVVLVRRRRETW